MSISWHERKFSCILFLIKGDILGPALANLENLLGLTSYGSGEQNMITFVPNVYISSYLKTTNRLTADIKTKTERLMQGGISKRTM